MATEQQADVAGVHRYKLRPPTYNGDIAHYEEWKYKFQAYMGLQHNDHTRLMRSTENATTTITELDIETAASTQAEADRWKQLSQEMKYILTSVTSGGAATICRQKESKLHSSLYHKNEQSMNSHTCHTEAGAQSAYRAKGDKITAKFNKADTQ